MSRPMLASPAQVAETIRVVGEAEGAFRSRWRMSTLRRVDPALHALLLEQIDLYSEDLIGGEQEPLREQSAAMVRGWGAACRVMETQPDDAYLIGLDWQGRTRVVISDSKQSIERARALCEQDGCALISLSPEEVARMATQMTAVTATKSVFPDAELEGFGRRMTPNSKGE